MNQAFRDKLRALMGPGWQEAAAPGSLYGSVIKEPDYDAPDTVGAGTPVGTDRRGMPVTAGDAQAIRHGYEFSGLGGLVNRRSDEEKKVLGGQWNPDLADRLKNSLQMMGEAAGGVLQMRGGIGKPGIPKKSAPSVFEMLGDAEVPRLTRQEANELAVKAKADPTAMEELITRLQPFVATVVQKHARKGGAERFDLDLMNDLMQEFNRRLPRMVERFNPAMRTRQSPTGEATQVPADFLSYVGNPKNELMLLQYKRSAQSPVGMSGPAGEKRLQKVDELDAPVPTRDDDTLSMHEVLEDVRQSSLRASGDMKIDAMNAFKKMRERDRQLLEMRLGIGEEEPLAESVIAARLGISQQAVHKALEGAEKRFRQALEETEIGKQAVEKIKRGGSGPAKPLKGRPIDEYIRTQQGKPPIGGGSDIDPGLQDYNRDWAQAYQNYQDIDAQTKRSGGMFGPLDTEWQSTLTPTSKRKTGYDAGVVNLPPRRGAPLSPHQEAIVDQLGVGRLRMPPVEPDPEIVRQLRAPQNLSSHWINVAPDSMGPDMIATERPIYGALKQERANFLSGLDPTSRDRILMDLAQDADVSNKAHMNRLYQSSKGLIPEMPMITTEAHGGIPKDIFGLRSEMWLTPGQTERQTLEILRALRERGLWP